MTANPKSSRAQHPANIILKLLFIGLATTIVHIVGQSLIPAGTQTVLAPSMFVQNGSMPLIFTLYGLIAYTLIASLSSSSRPIGRQKAPAGTALRSLLLCCMDGLSMGTPAPCCASRPSYLSPRRLRSPVGYGITAWRPAWQKHSIPPDSNSPHPSPSNLFHHGLFYGGKAGAIPLL